MLALTVILIWGTNFVVIHRGIEEFPPLVFATLRFAFAALPFAFIIRPPRISPWRVATYGLLIGVGQFSLLFMAMDGHITPGLASVLIQLQAFFTVGFAMISHAEFPERRTFVGLTLALLGLGLIWTGNSGEIDSLGLGLCLMAACSWAGGNIIAKGCQKEDAVPLVVWSSLAVCPVLMIMAYQTIGGNGLLNAVGGASTLAWLAAGWQGIGNSLIGYGIWNWLLTIYPAARIAPLSLLVPVVGLTASAVLLGEPMQSWKLAAVFLIIIGLGLNVIRLSSRH